ncbi:glutathione S-transferase family protein [Devosia sp. RR2S18]|uniref:glutathione S-transferase family protein n=1 Tax=Devosia rhizosphaerae TaxID=3049774 RepID=UPI002541ADEA|nr:glutathione S-transferase family protein [Devosia sp. RR2S18]WIJ23423.1 glutathione S-transferase family protein [Devosia sp. RR2S18]
MSKLRVFTFSPDWGLPTNGPFALKLLAWLSLAKIPYEQVIENNSSKGPKGKSPWVELDGERIADSELIIQLLARKHEIDLDADLSPEQLAIGHAFRRTFEEHFHQVLEWELLLTREGAAYMRGLLSREMPGPVSQLLFTVLKRHFQKQLFARGIARHSPEDIERKGKDDLDALAAYLQGRKFLGGEQPSTADAAVFGLLAPLLYWTMSTPVGDYAKSLPVLRQYCDRMKGLCFAQKAQANVDLSNRVVAGQAA